MESPVSGRAGLFMDTDEVGPDLGEARISRSRMVKINLGLLVGEDGTARDLGPSHEVMLNLFPDVTYIGVVERLEQEGDGYSWVGHLKGVELSTLTMVYTAGVFIGNFASPAGVYEVSNVGEDLYRIILIDQTKYPGGEDDIHTPAPDSQTY